MSFAFKMALDPRFAKLFKQATADVDGSSLKVALTSTQVFVAAYPQDAEANYLSARALLRADRFSEAIKFAEKAVALSPENANYDFFLGRLYLDFELYEFAAPLLRNAIVKRPDDFRSQCAMADFLMAIGKGHEARKHFETALSQMPEGDMKSAVQFNYAKCLEFTSAIDDAENIYLHLGADKNFSKMSFDRRANLRKHLPTSELAAEINLKLLNATADPSLKSELLLTLGNLYNNSKDYDRAFELWSESRSLRKTGRFLDLGQNIVELNKAFYTTELLAATEKHGHDSDRPLFVVGMPRSGTTLTAQILDAHSQCYGVGELGRVGKLANAFNQQYNEPNHVAKIISNAETGELRGRAEETLKLYTILAGDGAKYVVDKTPIQYLNLGYVHMCFPKAKFIHCQRHPADSFVSTFQNAMNEQHRYGYNQEEYAQTYLAKDAMMKYWQSNFGECIFDLHYEKLVSRPEETVRELLQFLELPWEENCMRFFETATTVKTFSNNQVRQPIYTSSVYRWKNYEKHLGPLFAALKAANFEYPEI